MTHQEFTAAVAEMRMLQKNYFKTRDRGVLDSCKFLEKKVDAYLESLDHQYNQLPLIK